jgi:hypothetical protein
VVVLDKAAWIGIEQSCFCHSRRLLVHAISVNTSLGRRRRKLPQG